MIYSSRLVNAVAFLAICAAILLSLVYLLWLAGGKIADWRERERRKPRSNIVPPWWAPFAAIVVICLALDLWTHVIEHFHWGPYR